MNLEPLIQSEGGHPSFSHPTSTQYLLRAYYVLGRLAAGRVMGDSDTVLPPRVQSRARETHAQLEKQIGKYLE